ncbi:MAG: rRNA maturation RNase YbeY [Spirochaetales bacterium]|nr:rRNA maturation RNase YbeY [Spirochaetales bacterium]
MNDVDLTLEGVSLPPEAEELDDFTLQVLERIGVEDWHMGLILTDDEGIRVHNREWRGLDRPTDVLSFAQSDGMDIPRIPGAPREAGDIILSLQTIQRNAQEWGSTFPMEIRRAVVHGILHLNGMDHPGDDYDGEMLVLQEQLLADWAASTNKK